MRIRSLILRGAAVAALAGAMLAQDAAAPSTRILHPEMAVGPDAGSYDQPAATMGEKNASPWTETTINAGVDKTPLPGHVVTVTGEVIDLSCYLQLGKHGEKHKACGTKCLQNGQPIGLLAKNGTTYMLIPEEHDPRRDGQTGGFRQAAIENFAKIVQVTGTETVHDGIHTIYLQGYVTK